MENNPENSNVQQTSPPPVPSSPGINWFIFLAILLAPVCLTSISALAKADGAATGFAMGGGIISGIICGITVGRHLGRNSGAKVALSIAFTAVFCVVCVGMSMFGCLASGFNLNFH